MGKGYFSVEERLVELRVDLSSGFFDSFFIEHGG